MHLYGSHSRHLSAKGQAKGHLVATASRQLEHIEAEDCPEWPPLNGRNMKTCLGKKRMKGIGKGELNDHGKEKGRLTLK